MEEETNTEQEKEENTRKEEERPKREENLFSDPTCRLTSFLALTVQYCLLVFRLWFEGWVVRTVLVKSPERLFQDTPSQFAYLGIAMKSCTDRLPRRTGLCVLFHTHLDHLHWSMDGMVEHEVDPLDLAEGFDTWEMLVPWDLESK